ncbi:MAG TPA: MlaD family protein [Aeromicrobium sp.]|nr:MlaD family protein [Aeromicrobium sp.]
MTRRSDRRIRGIGMISLAGLLLVAAATFNLQQFPGFRGQQYHAQVDDAAGLRVGAEVQVAGIRVGRVNKMHIDKTQVIIDFDVKGADLGDRTHATIEVKNLLGEKFLNLVPAGDDDLASGALIPAHVSWDIVGTLGTLTTNTEKTDTEQLTAALGTLAETLRAATPDAKATFAGLSRLSESIASRDAEIGELLTRAQTVLETLESRKGDLVSLMGQARQVFDELHRRRDAIHDLLVDADALVVQLRGVVKDNTEQLRPTLDTMEDVLGFLEAREDKLEALLRNYGPYVDILGNIVGSGPWFDGYVPNIQGIFTGEFTPPIPLPIGGEE